MPAIGGHFNSVANIEPIRQNTPALPLPIGNDSCKLSMLASFAPPRAGRFLLIETAAQLGGD
jgi:hypothetical protein